MHKKSKKSPRGAESRRTFIRKSSLAAAAVAGAANLLKTPVYGQNQAPSAGVIGANDRIVVGFVGVGHGIGKAHLNSIKKHAGENNVAIGAVCELYKQRLDFARTTAGLSEAHAYSDYRKLLQQKDIDAVVISTHDVWHAPIGIDAMNAGKHIYCEKPITRYLDEAFALHDAVKKTGKVFQVGSQGCSAQAWHSAADIIRKGEIGKLVWAQGYYCRNNPKGEWNYTIDETSTEQNIDWKTWLGKVNKRIPFSADHFHRWRKYYPYCSGLLGDLVPHRLHPLMLASGNPEFPSRVSCVSSKAVLTDQKTPDTFIRDVPEHVQMIAEFPSGFSIVIVSSSVNAKSPGFVIYGHHATLEIGNLGERLTLTPERQFTDEIDQQVLDGLKPTEAVATHEKNWFDCIRSGKAPNGNIDLAIRVQTAICLAEMSDRLRITCEFDEKTRKITAGGKAVPAITYGSLELS